MEAFPADRSESCAALGVLVRLHAGEDPGSPAVSAGLRLVAALPPRWAPKEGCIDYYYWRAGAEALATAGSQAWPRWWGALETALVRAQRSDGERTGSWDPVDPWGEDGGRVYSTAICVLALETPYRCPTAAECGE